MFRYGIQQIVLLSIGLVSTLSLCALSEFSFHASFYLPTELALSVVNVCIASPYSSIMLQVTHYSSCVFHCKLASNDFHGIVFVHWYFVVGSCFLPSEHSLFVGRATCLEAGCKQR